MAARHLFIAHTPLALMQAAAAARRQGARAQLLLSADFALAERFARVLKRWRDNPFEAITRLPGAPGGLPAQRGLGAFLRRFSQASELRRETSAALREIDRRFEPDAVWVGDEGR